MASEFANNALIGGALIPLSSLGISGHSTTEVLIGVFTLQSVQVGPLFILESTDTWYIMMTAWVFASLLRRFDHDSEQSVPTGDSHSPQR